MSKEKNNKKLNTGLYLSIFFVCVILIIMLFFVKKDNIVSNLKKTNFFERVGVSTPEFVQKHQEKNPKPVVEEEYEFDLMGGKTKTTVTNVVEPVEKKTEIAVEAEKSIDREILQATKAAESVKTENFAEKTPTAVKTVEPAEKINVATSVPQTRNANLCFVVIDSDGRVNRKVISRALPKSDSPLTDAIKALLAGPLPGEGNCRSLIPAGTRLIGASVKNGVATLNFNESFEFNSVGVEGCIAQLMQIVYTATEFSTVKSVQFLIEGEKKEYLGTEGQWIGSPLSRNNF